ncbi:MAG: hypothetical protein ACTH32_06585 [Microbacterium gubbeenense]|uniref:hypothetical protein n=1 Tax=Microbacterium gubbeenense TaxID=159896 RepID=UPI003F971D34
MTTAPELDPYPYKVQIRPELIDPAERADYLANREDERISSPAWVTFWDQEVEECIFAPRPEYSQNRKDYPA